VFYNEDEIVAQLTFRELVCMLVVVGFLGWAINFVVCVTLWCLV
jgi:hypothetical protein